MPFDYGRLKSSLSETKLQSEDNALYQTIFNLIKGVSDKFVDLDAVNATVQAALDQIQKSPGSIAVKFVSVDTSGGATAFTLDDYVGVNEPVVFKDVTGNAAANNITLTGTVDGVANPTINTNFGVFRVYKNDVNGNFNEW